jgi:hypothetical protein
MATKNDDKGKQSIDKVKSQSSPQQLHDFGKFLVETEAKAHQIQQQTLWEKIKNIETHRAKGGTKARERALERIYADMEALETSRELMSLSREARLFQKHDLKSFVQLFEDDWKLAWVKHQAQVKRARLWILAPIGDVGFLVRLGRVLSIAFWSGFLLLHAAQTGIMRTLRWAFAR